MTSPQQNNGDLSQMFTLSPRQSPDLQESPWPPDPQPEQQREPASQDLDGMIWKMSELEPMRQPSPFARLVNSGAIQTSARNRHGQITPPSEPSPCAPTWNGAFPEPGPMLGAMQSPVPHPTTLPILGRAPSATPAPEPSTQAKPPVDAEAAPKRRRGRVQKSQSGSKNNSKMSEEKRAGFLERNRKAATKCRAKKKAWTSDLSRQADDTMDRNKYLHGVVAQLREEVLYLKSEVLRHTNCSCPALQQYISREVMTITGFTGLAYHELTNGGVQHGLDQSPVAQSAHQVNDTPMSDADFQCLVDTHAETQ